LYFQNAAGKVFYHPAGYVHLGWSPERLPLETLQDFYEQALTLMRRRGVRKLLSDHGQRAPLVASAQDWLTGNWIPRAVAQARFRHLAIVEGSNPLHRLATQSVMSGAPEEVVFSRFGSVEEADAWLREVNE
jgi:hypothetical protein